MRAIHTLDTAFIMGADTIAGYIEGLLDWRELKQTAYALYRESRKVTLARFFRKVAGNDAEHDEEKRLAD